MDGAALDEPKLLHLAATGDRGAQAQLIAVCIAKQLVGVPPFEALAAAEPFARMAASHGLVEDQLSLAAVLRIRAVQLCEVGQVDRAAALLAEAEDICDQLAPCPPCQALEFLAGVLATEADAGDESAALRLNALMASLRPDEADRLRNSINRATKEVAALAEALNG